MHSSATRCQENPVEGLQGRDASWMRNSSGRVSDQSVLANGMVQVAGMGPSGQVRCTAERQTTTDFWGTCVAQACKASGGATGLWTALAQVQPQC